MNFYIEICTAEIYGLENLRDKYGTEEVSHTPYIERYSTSTEYAQQCGVCACVRVDVLMLR